MARILVGISSWAEPELLKSGFYPPEVKSPAERLRYYASQFTIAEIDSSFHFFPTRHNLALWMENTPDGFTFDVKAFSIFTRHPTPFKSLPRTVREKCRGQIQDESGSYYLHHLPQKAVDDLWDIFSGTVDRFQAVGKLGAVLFQFPPWFHPEPGNYDHIAGCRERLARYPVAVEFRVGSWLERHKEETLEFMRRRDIALVCVDEPQGLRSSVPPVAEMTAALSIVRFHGRNSESWEGKGIPATERFNYLYGENELAEWVPRIRDMAGQAKELHVIFKNKHAGFPVRNAVQMKGLLGLT